MTDVLNKTLRLVLDPNTNAGIRSNAIDQLRRMVGNETIKIGEDEELAALKREKAKTKLELLSLKELCENWYNQLVRIQNALTCRETLPFASGNDAVTGNTKQWMIEKLIEAGTDGVSKKALMANQPSNVRASITKRWSELQTGGDGFLIRETKDDQIMVHYNHRSSYPAQFKLHQKRSDARRATGTTKRRDIVKEVSI